MRVSAMLLNRRYFLVGALSPAALARKPQTPPRPNILLVLADGLGSWMLGCYGNQEIRTPNIDRLAQAGVRFQHHTVCIPASSPSRATLLTGRVPRQHGIHDFLTSEIGQNPPQGQATPPESFKNEIMLSEMLAGQGYECGYAGKWHMGADQNAQHGFRFWQTLMLDAAPSYQNPRMSVNGQVVTEAGYLTELTTAKAGQFLDQQTSG